MTAESLKPVDVAIVGATGLVGLEMRKILQEPAYEGRYRVHLFASQARPSDGVHNLSDSWAQLSQCPYVLNGATGEVAQEIADHLKMGQVMIDNSSRFRMDPEVPLVVPEINGEILAVKPPIVANPNCTAILLCLTLAPFKDVGLSRVVVATYQAASGAGIKGLEELEAQSKAYGLGQTLPKPEVFPFHLVANVLSHNSEIRAEDTIGGGYNEEEWKVVEETRKILDIRHLAVSATCMRVPVKRAHTEAITIDVKVELPLNEIRERLAKAPGLKVVDDWQNNHFPMPIEAEMKDDVLVGRIRKDLSLGKTFHLLLAGDQIRKGAALNAIQIMEAMRKLP